MHGWRLSTGKICLPFKTMKNIKIGDPVLTMDSFYDQDDILQKKKVKIPLSQKVRFEGISLQPPWLANRN